MDVIVLSKDRPDLFCACLAHLQAQEVDYHGFLVDNGNDGVTGDMARRHGWTVLEPGRNTGFSEGNNLAIREGSSERVLLLNNDAYVQPGSLRALLGHDEGIVAPVVVNPDGTTNYAGGIFTGAGSPRHRGRGTASDAWDCRETEWATFACVLIRRDLLEQVGPMDEGYWYGYEDVDYSLRATDAGWRIAVCGDARVIHYECSTRDGADMAENRDRFFARWGSRTCVPGQVPSGLRTIPTGG